MTIFLCFPTLYVHLKLIIYTKRNFHLNQLTFEGLATLMLINPNQKIERTKFFLSFSSLTHILAHFNITLNAVTWSTQVMQVMTKNDLKSKAKRKDLTKKRDSILKVMDHFVHWNLFLCIIWLMNFHELQVKIRKLGDKNDGKG